jgi:hypothetical protein
MIGKKLRDKKLAKLIESHSLKDNANVTGIAAAMATSLPAATAESVFYSSVYICEILTEFAENMTTHDKEIVAAERLRIRQIVDAGIGVKFEAARVAEIRADPVRFINDAVATLHLALETDLSAADAARALSARAANPITGATS